MINKPEARSFPATLVIRIEPSAPSIFTSTRSVTTPPRYMIEDISLQDLKIDESLSIYRFKQRLSGVSG